MRIWLRIPDKLHWPLEIGNRDIKHEQITLPSGRRLSFAGYGAPDGRVLFYFHGFPGSRLEAALIDDSARDLGIRVIGIDRPGYGSSEPQAQRRLVDWPADVWALAATLNVATFSVLGVSGGGPYALACAASALPGLERATVVGGLGPLHGFALTAGLATRRRIGCLLARVAPWLIPLVNGRMCRQIADSPARVLDALMKQSSEPDRETLRNPGVWEVLAASFQEGVRAQAGGGAEDLRAYLSPWGFDFAQIRVPLTLWHGANDQTVPASMSRRIAKRVKGSDLRLLAGEGHYSLPVRHSAAILRSACAVL